MEYPNRPHQNCQAPHFPTWQIANFGEDTAI
jgi:hypothetical protein